MADVLHMGSEGGAERPVREERHAVSGPEAALGVGARLQPTTRVVRSKKLRTEVIEVPVVHHEVRVPVEVEVPVEVPYEVTYEVPIPYEVTREVVVPFERLVENVVEHRIEVEVPYPQEYQTIVEKVVEKRVPVPGPVKYVERVVEVEKIVEVEVPIERIHHIPVPYPVEKVVEKVVKVPHYIERVVKVPFEKVVTVEKPVDKIRYVRKEVKVPHHVDKVVERYVKVPVDKIVKKQVPYTVEKIMERIEKEVHIREVTVPVEKIVEKVVEKRVPVDKVVQKKVPVTIEKIVEIEKPRYVQKIVEKIVHVPIEKVTERRVEVPIDRIVHVPIDRVVDRMGMDSAPMDKVVYNPVADSPYLFQFQTVASSPPAPPGWKWVPFSTETYEEALRRVGPDYAPPALPGGAAAPGPGSTSLPGGLPPGGQLNIIDRFIYVDPDGNVVDERADMWTESGLDPSQMHQKMLQAQQAGFHRSDPFWDAHFDEFAHMAAAQSRPVVNPPLFDHPVELNYHGPGRAYP
eukprot:EG_transcript_5831